MDDLSGIVDKDPSGLPGIVLASVVLGTPKSGALETHARGWH